MYKDLDWNDEQLMSYALGFYAWNKELFKDVDKEIAIADIISLKIMESKGL